jgi:UDP-N-acetylmuramyl-tripeptide synthetase
MKGNNMELYNLLSGIEIIKSKVENKEIKYISSDSRRIKESYIFVALKGGKRNGNDYIEEAIKRGCVCIISDDENVFYEYDNVVLTYNTRRALSILWNNFYKSPTRNIKMIGITGTNGKTSSAYYLYSILKKSKKKVGLISTVECLIDDKRYEFGGGGETQDIISAMTTPDPEYLYEIFAKMRDCKIEYIVMEVSSHALELSKVYPIQFEIGVFTNLSKEHLDFHINMDNYFLSKLKLLYSSKYAIINADEEYSNRINRYINREFISFGTNDKSDCKISHIVEKVGGSVYSLNMNNKILRVETNICGRFFVYNSAVAAICAMLLNIDNIFILDGIRELTNIPGRMEKIIDGIYIDYAHTPLAMEGVINTTREIAQNKKIIVLFGCGGDRDRSKRAQMGKIATDLADIVIITSDNPRNEDQNIIINDIVMGVKEDAEYYVIPNRKEAIEFALKIRNDKILLLLGKGHEKYEIDSMGKHEFNEREIVETILSKNDKFN